MKVLEITPSYPRYVGDYHGRFIRDLCEAFYGRGIDVSVLAPRSRTMGECPSAFPVERFPYLPLRCMELLPEETMKGAPFGHIAQLPPYMASAYLHMIREDVDVVHAHLAIPLGLMGTLNPRGTPLIVTSHGSDCSLPYTNAIYRPFTRRTLRKADAVVAVSEYVKHLAMGLGALPDKVEVIYLGVNTSKFKPPPSRDRLKEELGIPTDTVVIGSLGRLVPEKRVEDLIRAAAHLKGRLDYQILVGGDGPERPALEKMASEVAGYRISFLGRVSDAPGFHRLCDIYVLTSVREGLSVSLQEAMATGCTPVAVNGFGCPELVVDGENGFLFRPRDPVDLAKKIELASRNPGMGRRAMETVTERFDLRENAGRYVELFNELA